MEKNTLRPSKEKSGITFANNVRKQPQLVDFSKNNHI